ncbi:MAG: hypothetical protein JSW68_00580 [Burkholderiales bacterium]|nr:MAG: hypothetical protein JSW68_00580 [Burkholderiales bacterium]
MDKLTLTPLERFSVPIGGQEIELQQLDYAVGGMSLLRTRIREGRRFTVFDIDPLTARRWGEALVRWAEAQPGVSDQLPEAGPDGG